MISSATWTRRILAVVGLMSMKPWNAMGLAATSPFALGLIVSEDPPEPIFPPMTVAVRHGSTMENV